MPTYEYICSKCNAAFDLYQSITESPIAICPKDLCRQKRWGKGKVKRGITAGAGLIFKGSGFYITDYRSDKYKEAAKKESPAPAASSESKSAPAKVETPAAKTTPSKAT
jgi:putative FmdB family regulatory protein